MAYKSETNSSGLKDAFVAIFLWSLQAVLLRTAYQKSDFSAVLFESFAFSSVYIIIYKNLVLKKSSKDFNELFRLGDFRCKLLGVSLFFGYHLCLFWGLSVGPVVETNLINFLWPIFFLILGQLLIKTKKNNKRIPKVVNHFYSRCKKEQGLFQIHTNIESPSVFIRIIVAFSGAFLLITNGHFEKLNLASWQGPAFGLLAAVCWALFSILLLFSGNTSYLSLYIWGATISSFIIWLLRGAADLLPSLPVAILLGLFPLGYAMSNWESALKRNAIDDISALAFFAPFFSTLWLVLFKISEINWQMGVGGVLIIMANINLRLLKNKLR